MFLLERLSFKEESEDRSWLSKVKVEVHTPVMMGEHVFFCGFEGLDKNYSLRTTRVVDMIEPDENTIEFKTKSGSAYRITKL